MSNTSPHVNPLFAAAVSPPATVASRAVKFGGYGGIAVAAWLFTAVATGYGYAAADESADSTSSSSSVSSSTGGESPTGTGGHPAKDTESTSSTDAQSADSPTESEGSSEGAADASDNTETDNADAAADDTVTGGNEQDATEPDPAPAEDDEPDDEASPLPPSDTGAPATSSPVGHETPLAVKHSPATGTDVKAAAVQQETATPQATPAAATAAIDDDESVDTPSEPAVTAVPTVRSATLDPGGAAAATASAVTVVAPGVRAGAPTGLVGLVNAVVTKLLDPFLAPAPSTPDPFTPALWAVLGWVRRNLFNEAPTVSFDPATTVQTGQTVTGTLGASDAEHDALTYTVVQGPQYGTVTIDQATGTFTYTPNDIDYDAAQTDSFTVSVNDGRVNLLSAFGQSHSARADVDVTVLNPTVSRVILNLPGTLTSPANPRYAEDGKSIYFAAQPTAGGRSEIYQIGVDGTDLQCVTCGVTPSETGNLAKPVPVNDGSGRVLVLVQAPNQSPRYSMLEDGAILPISTPAGGGFAIDKQREMRVSPDGKKVLFTRIVIGPNNLLQALPIVGTLNRTATGYEVVDARVVYPTGEGKQWTPDGKGVLILGGQFDAGYVDDIEVDLATGKVTRVTANLDYDEDLDMSPNEKWIAIGSTRGLDALTPMTRIVRQNFLPVYVGAPVYLSYAVPVNVSNQEWAVALEDELRGENGIPLFDTGDGYAARSMPSWNATGDAVTFWESSVADPTQSRLVIANLRYTTSVGPVDADRTTPNPGWAPNLSTYVPTTTPLPAVGTYAGPKGGSAVVTEAPDPIDPTRTIRTVTYTDYVNSDGMILNGTESADYNASQVDVHYLADVTVTGTHTGSLTADATINAFQQSLTGHITSVLDGDRQDLPNPAAAHEAQQNA